jgi:hypothetical protein
VVVPMTRLEVRSAIVEPARLARLAVEDGLVELLLRDLAPHAPEGGPPGAAHEAGALPLLSHALLTTWYRSHGGRLTVADYQASGGIRHAIARTADQVYEALGEGQRDIARRLFLRLVYVAGDAPETRSSVPLAELRDWPGEATPPGEVLSRFVAERLITVDAETAQITHEALLTAWPLLRTWVDANREGLRVRRRLSDAARAWDEAGRDPAALLRGGQLALARDWAADPVNRDGLGTLTGAFVNAGIAADRAQQAADRNRALRLRRLVAALTVLVEFTAFSPRGRLLATSGDDGTVRLWSVNDPAHPRLVATLHDSGTYVFSVAFSPDGRTLAAASADDLTRLWNVSQPGHAARIGAPLAGPSSHAISVAFSPGGRILAVGSADKTVRLWNVTDLARPVRLGRPLTGPAAYVYR